MEITKREFFERCEKWRQHLAALGKVEYCGPWSEAKYEEKIALDPEFIYVLQSWYDEQLKVENGTKLRQPYIRMAPDLAELLSKKDERQKESIVPEVVEAEVMDTLPSISPNTSPAVINSRLPVSNAYVQNNYHFYSPSKPVQLPQYTAHERKNHSLVTDDYDVVALVEDFQRKIPYVCYQKRVYIYLQVYEQDVESTAWVYQTHEDLIGRLNWFYKKELGKIGSTKIIKEVVRYIETDLTHTIRDLDETTIKSRVQFLGRYYDLNRKQWHQNTPSDFFPIYLNVRGIEVQNWNNPLVIFNKMMINICQGNQKTFQALTEMLATCMSRTLEYKGCFFLGGPADSGKSALIHLVELFYPASVKKHKSIQELMVDKELSELEGIALNTQEELASTIFSPEETAFFKKLTSGNDTEVTSGKKYFADVTFKLMCHHVFATNVEVLFSNFTQAVWNRVIYIGLDHEIPMAYRIRNLNKLLANELPGIMQKLLPVLQSLWDQGFQFTRNCEINTCVDNVVCEPSHPRSLSYANKVATFYGNDVATFVSEVFE